MRGDPVILQIHMKRFHSVIQLLLNRHLTILNSETVHFTIIKLSNRLYFHACELFCILAWADRNVFAGILGAVEVMKSQNGANKKLFFSEMVSPFFLFIGLQSYTKKCREIIGDQCIRLHMVL